MIGFGRGCSLTTRTTVALATLVSFLTATCSVSRWQPIAPTEPSVHQEKLSQDTVRVLMPRGWVVLEVEKMDYPFLEGTVRSGTGEVQFDLRRARSAATISMEGGSLVRRPLSLGTDDLQATDLAGRQLQFEDADGPVALIVSKFDYPFVRGRLTLCLMANDSPERCGGRVRIDLREAQDLSIKRTDTLKTIGACFLVVGIGLWGLILLYAAGGGEGG